MRALMFFVLLTTIAGCATNREPASQNGGAPQAIEDGSFPGRSN